MRGGGGPDDLDVIKEMVSSGGLMREAASTIALTVAGYCESE